MSVVKNAAAVAGIASLPTPITDESDDSFFLWQPWLTDFLFLSAIGIDNNNFTRYDFDSKAKRKITQGDTIVVTMENASATFAAEFVIKFRMLIMTQ